MDDCTCYSDCSSGSLKIYEDDNCNDLPDYDITISGGNAKWYPKNAVDYMGRIDWCDDTGGSSACQAIKVIAKSTTTAYWSPHTTKRTTTKTRTTTTSTRTTTTRPRNATTTTQGIILTTTTTTGLVTTTIEETTPFEETTTTFYICDRDEACETQQGENYGNCPRDCPSGFPDDYCDKVEDGRCDPDCLSWEDPDCKISRCGDGICDENGGENAEICPEDCATIICGDNFCDYGKGENYSSCDMDCPSGSKDDYCDKISDGRCDPDCKSGEDPDCSGGLIPTWLGQYFWILLILLLLLIVLVILFFIYRRGKKSGYDDKNTRIMAWVKKKLKDGEDPEIIKKGLEAEGYDPGLVDKAEEKLWES